jgi:hypothetical protein
MKGDAAPDTPDHRSSGLKRSACSSPASRRTLSSRRGFSNSQRGHLRLQQLNVAISLTIVLGQIRRLQPRARLANRTLHLDGKDLDITELLADRERSTLVSDEGPMDPPRYPPAKTSKN